LSPPSVETENVRAAHLLASTEAVEALDQVATLQLRKEAKNGSLRAPHKARNPRDRRERVRAIVSVRGEHEEHDTRLRRERRVARDPRRKHGPSSGRVVAARVRVELQPLHVRAAL
jgi:hypothetical protein